MGLQMHTLSTRGQADSVGCSSRLSQTELVLHWNLGSGYGDTPIDREASYDRGLYHSLQIGKVRERKLDTIVSCKRSFLGPANRILPD